MLNQVSIKHYLGFENAGFRALFQVRVELSEKDRQSLATSGERFRNWLEQRKADDGPADS